MATSKREERYLAYERALDGLCPSCRRPWKWVEKERAWQVVHTNACRYVPWFEAQEAARAQAGPTAEVSAHLAVAA